MLWNCCTVPINLSPSHSNGTVKGNWVPYFESKSKQKPPNGWLCFDGYWPRMNDIIFPYVFSLQGGRKQVVGSARPSSKGMRSMTFKNCQHSVIRLFENLSNAHKLTKIVCIRCGRCDFSMSWVRGCKFKSGISCPSTCETGDVTKVEKRTHHR